ncbi:MAG: hypothetical protein Q8T11_04775 [Elusimicrobiota bacterium]|nr:hypothetical protein [Elusimicrobiota bacterium]
MKNNRSLISTWLLAAGAALLAAGCAGTETLSASPALPAAEGTVRCAKAANDNTSIDLKVKHLANPDRLTPPAAVYVVWTKTDKDAEPRNIGALTVDESLTGRLKTVTSLRRFELFVTGEATGQAPSPSGEPVLWANCSR